jgi:hypothetical protein
MRTHAYWSSGCGRLELSLTLAQARSGAHSGSCDAGVLALSQEPAIAAQVGAWDRTLLRDVLREYGAWDDAELADDAQNVQRMLWIACGDIVDENA